MFKLGKVELGWKGCMDQIHVHIRKVYSCFVCSSYGIMLWNAELKFCLWNGMTGLFNSRIFEPCGPRLHSFHGRPSLPRLHLRRGDQVNSVHDQENRLNAYTSDYWRRAEIRGQRLCIFCIVWPFTEMNSRIICVQL